MTVHMPAEREKENQKRHKRNTLNAIPFEMYVCTNVCMLPLVFLLPEMVFYVNEKFPSLKGPERYNRDRVLPVTYV